MTTTSNNNQENTVNQTMVQNEGQAGNALANSYSNAQTQSPSSSAKTQSGTMQASGQGVKSVIGVFNSRADAEKGVNALRAQGFTTEEINIVSKNKNNQKQQQQGSEYFEDDITDGALTGGTLGGIGGLLLGAGALAIPGVGPILAAGPIAAALSGAVAGGIAGGLIDWGIPAEAGKRYEQQVAQGGILAIIRSDAAKVNQAAQILRQNGAKDVETHELK
ncbi:general stress protein [Sporomusa sp.]|uniref:general stress protein n=1 Tax=Sporomusa sp. TaxID=2078658 RepID=UPI002CD0423E|nr:general stress protein [Sporomusa sp.]HWR07993.1 general stress protein [Sporomusa sp.]